ncbi:MAG: T9SS type A sorting domain-containing protein [Ignavibacteriae bacterium]|nr:T9SS type A sorting domain-containing protein [Ignavibacteriota bacterium]
MKQKLLICGAICFWIALSILHLSQVDRGESGVAHVKPEDQEQYALLLKLRAKLSPESPEGMRVVERSEKIERRAAGYVKSDEPDEFAKHLYEMRVSYGAFAPDYPRNYRLAELAKATNRASHTTTLLDWKERGPGNVPGRARGLVVDPGDPALNTWYVASVGGGVWKTSNGGNSWRELTRTMPNLAMSALVQSPSTPNIMYAGTGESFYSVDVINGDGILKSTDRGETWTQLASTVANDDFNNIARLIIHPTNPNIVLAATTSGRYKEATVNRSGIWKTTNGGTSWYNVYNQTEIGTLGRVKKILQILDTPGNFNIQYACVDEKGILKSTDAGESWFLSSTGINDQTGRYEMAIAPSNVNKLYLAAEGSPNSNLYVSSDAGATWKLTTVSGTNTNWLSSQGWYDNTIVVHPTNENKMYVGGVNIYTITMINDSTRTIASVSTSGVHVDHHNLMTIPKPGGGFRILNANDGGIGLSIDSSSGWVNPGFGMITSQFYGVDKKPGASAYFGGMQDNGTYQSPDNPNALTSWSSRIGGDGYETSWHFDDPLKLIGGSQYNGLRRSTNGGTSFSSATSGMTGNTGSGNAPFITKVGKTNKEPELLFAVGKDGVFKSTNFGQSWALTAIPAGTWGSVSSFHNVKVSKSNPNIVWAGARMDPSGKIFVSTDKGATFNPVPDYTGTTLGGIAGIATHPLQDSTAYVLFGFAKKPKIIRTMNLGQTWEDITGFSGGPISTNGFPDVVPYDLVVLPHTPNTIWVGTEIGLFESTNNGVNWHIANNGLPAASIWNMQQVEDEVVVATHGRGIWSVNIPGMSAGQTFKPLLGSMAQGPDGFLSINVTLRSLYDSTVVFIDGARFLKIGANATTMRDTLVKYPVLQADTLVVAVTSYKGGVSYASLSRTAIVTVVSSPRAFYTNTFNAASSDFTGTGFSIQTPAGFADGAIHTAHPYTNNLNNSYMLTVPVTVAATNAFFAYDDIAIVEPGEPGVPFGDPLFYDYVVVEGTRDGLTWTPLANGYDARYDTTWLNAYNASASGNSTMYRHHELNLRDKFNAGENIFVRFRLYTDASATGWGWAIENLEIQQRITDAPEGNSVPTIFALAQNYPNPFNPTTAIGYQLPTNARVVLKIYNINGQEVRTLVNELQPAGSFTATWDGRATNGFAVASGIYFYRLIAGSFAETKKMILLR